MSLDLFWSHCARNLDEKSLCVVVTRVETVMNSDYIIMNQMLGSICYDWMKLHLKQKLNIIHQRCTGGETWLGPDLIFVIRLRVRDRLKYLHSLSPSLHLACYSLGCNTRNEKYEIKLLQSQAWSREWDFISSAKLDNYLW